MKNEDGNFYNPDENETAFRVNYSPKISPYIAVNGHWISRPHFTSNIGDFFAYIHNNPNRTITAVEVEEQTKIKLQKGMDDILRDLGFRGSLAKVFFKEMTNSQVYFVNPVSHGYLQSLNIDMDDTYKLIFTPKRKSAIFPTN